MAFSVTASFSRQNTFSVPPIDVFCVPHSAAPISYLCSLSELSPWHQGCDGIRYSSQEVPCSTAAPWVSVPLSSGHMSQRRRAFSEYRSICSGVLFTQRRLLLSLIR